MATSGSNETICQPKGSSVPPRFPLASTTVPCLQRDCPRSAIGRGIGLWKDSRARYGPSQALFPNRQVLPGNGVVGQDGSPSHPIDGFVTALNEDALGLTVVSAQSRASYNKEYAISKFSLAGRPLEEEQGSLRTDVTLSKVIEVLLRHSGSSVQELPRSYRSSTNALRRRFRGHQITEEKEELDHISDRTKIDPRFLAVMGASESEMEPGTVGCVSAVQESSDDDAEEPKIHTTFQVRSAYDDSDDEIGGAFARSGDLVTQREKRSRRNTIQQEWILDQNQENQNHIATSMPVQPIEDVQDDTSSDDDSSRARGNTKQSLHAELLDVLECQLCYQLLFQPLTTPCGHTFCRKCFARSLDHSSTCPLCRAEMPSFTFFQDHPYNKVIMQVIMGDTYQQSDSADCTDVQQKYWGLKELYEEREAAIEREEAESLLSTPIFVCTLGFPHMPTILHIFEPRYRLMIRRCLESGNPRFGMVMHSQNTSGATPGMSPYGTMLDIKTVQMLPDGRSMIETIGSSRFRVLERGSLDGYTVGRIEIVEDVSNDIEFELELASVGLLGRWNSAGADPTREAGHPTEASESASVAQGSSPYLSASEAREAYATFQEALGLEMSNQTGASEANIVRPKFLQRTTKELVDVCLSFINTLRSGSAPWLMTRLNDTYGPMPNHHDTTAFGYWMALVMPIDEQEKAKLLPIRSARLRLMIVVHWIEQLRQTWWFNHGCSVQ